MTTALPWRETDDGVELAVRLTPRGGSARIEGIADRDGYPCLKVRVAAPPVDGAAAEARGAGGRGMMQTLAEKAPRAYIWPSR